jgi:DNA-binding CsgD family transcriptional regulator
MPDVGTPLGPVPVDGIATAPLRHGLAEVLARAERAVRRGPGAVLVGDAGAGKSHSARRLATRLRARGMIVEFVLATEAARAVPFGAFAGLLDPVAVASGDLLEIMRGTGARLARRAGREGLVVIVDDAHRLDPASAALLLALVTRDRIRVLVTIRSQTRAPDAVIALAKDAGVHLFEIAPLSEAGITELARGVLGNPLERATRRWLWQTSGGNPLFARELIHWSTARGTLVLQRGHWRRIGSAGDSGRLLDLLGERIQDLTDDERRALALVTLAEPIELELLTRLEVLDAVRALEDRGLVAAAEPAARGARLRIGHPLYGEAIRGSLGVIEMRTLHQELETALDPADETVRLRLAVWALEDGRPVKGAMLAEATELALRAFDPELAIRCGEAALRVSSGVSAALPLASALRAVGRLEEAEERLAAVEEEAGPAERTAYLFARAMNLQVLGRRDEVDALLGRVGDGSALAAVTAAVRSEAGRLRVSVESARRALSQPSVDRLAASIAAVALGHDLALLGDPDGALDVIDEVAHANDGVESEWPLAAIATIGAFYAARDWPARLEALCRRHAAAASAGDDGRAALCELTLSSFVLATGDLEAARGRAQDALARLAFMDPRALASVCFAVIAESEAYAGRPERARAALESGLAVLERSPATPMARGLVESVRPFVLAAEGDERGAQSAALAAADACGEAIMTEAQLLHAYLRVGGGAGRVAPRLVEIAGDTRARMAKLWARQAVAARDRDGAGLEVIAAEFEAVGARLYAAEAAAQAATSYGCGGGDACRRAQARAARLAMACGAHGLTLVSTMRVAELTVREREIARLVGHGLSNAQIATRLSLSVRTVESHIYRATTKLGVHDRGELGALVKPGSRSDTARGTLP